MIKWDDAQTISQKLANDTNASETAFIDLMMNQGYKEALHELNIEAIEEERAASTVANRRDYQFPVDVTWISDITILNGTTKYPLTEVKSRRTWERMTSSNITGIPEFFHVQPRKGVGGQVVLFEPIPNATYTIRSRFETTSKDLSAAAYTIGSAAINNDSTDITGTGTTWSAEMIGRYFRATDADGDGLWYRVADFTSTTEIVLENYYQGTNYDGNYEIAEVFDLPEDVHMAPIFYAMWHYFAFRRAKTESQLYRSQWDQLLTRGREKHANKTRDTGLEYHGVDSFLRDYPGFFPSDGVS